LVLGLKAEGGEGVKFEGALAFTNPTTWVLGDSEATTTLKKSAIIIKVTELVQHSQRITCFSKPLNMVEKELLDDVALVEENLQMMVELSLIMTQNMRPS
jgi:hypothetical protein